MRRTTRILLALGYLAAAGYLFAWRWNHAATVLYGAPRITLPLLPR